MEYHLVSHQFVKHFGACQMSKILNQYGESVRIVQVSFTAIEEWAKKQEEKNPEFLDENNIWTQQITESILPVDNFNLKEVRDLDYTIFEWIMNEFDLSQPRNVADIIGSVCLQENLTPIQLFNKLYKKS